MFVFPITCVLHERLYCHLRSRLDPTAIEYHEEMRRCFLCMWAALVLSLCTRLNRHSMT